MDPQSEDAVRRLLADARHTEPMPVDVAARLDAVLGRLAAEADPGADAAAAPQEGRAAALGTPVVPLDRHRRALGRRLLIAAAAVIVVGAGAAQVLPLDPLSAGSGDSAASSAVAGGTGAEDALPDPATDAPRSPFPEAGAGSAGSGPGGADTSAPNLAGTAAAPQATTALRDRVARVATARPLRVASDTFVRDVERVRRRTSPAAAVLDSVRSAKDPAQDPAKDPAQGAASDPANARGEAAACAPGPFGPGRLVLVVFRGDPAVLAFRPRRGGSAQVVDLLQCGSAEVLRSTTLR